jgi:hypothetical protein
MREDVDENNQIVDDQTNKKTPIKTQLHQAV